MEYSMLNLTRTADYLSANLESLGFIIMSKRSGEGLPLVAFRLPAGKYYDEFQLAHQLRERGWVVPAYTMAPHSDKLRLMRVVVREDFSKSRCDALINDIKFAVQYLDKLDEKKTAEHKEHIQRMVVDKWKTGAGRRRMSTVYNDEEHSLQGKHGKTHAVC